MQKSPLTQSLESAPQQYPIQNTTSHHVTPTKQQWQNRHWAFTEQTSTTASTHALTSYTTHKSPLVETENMDVMGYKQRPTGQNCVVAVLSFEGYNMEDAIIFNKASIERGLARSTFYRIYEAECRQYLGGLKDKFTVPEPGTRGYRGEQYYRLLEPDGIISFESQ
jgi:DNA-directed RNA polymerase subunit B